MLSIRPQKYTKIHWKMFYLWSQKDLSLYGKITIAKSLEDLHTAFVWNNKPAKVKEKPWSDQKRLVGKICLNTNPLKKSKFVAWANRMIKGSDENWMAISSYYLKKMLEELSFLIVIMTSIYLISRACPSFI